MSVLAGVVINQHIVVCCGPGGVGKTTTAAALALEAAAQGRKACVVTIDPARRLADALGIGELTNEPSQVHGIRTTGHKVKPGGELWALMLDTRTTFDDVVSRTANSQEQAQRILDNKLYRNLSGALGGTQEYMAMEKLHELATNPKGSYPDFDLIVIDTPPTRNALDFLDAPDRLASFLDHKLFRAFMGTTRGFQRIFALGAQAFLKTVTKTVGSGVVDDVAAFFSAFHGMEGGFRVRAGEVRDLLASPSTSFVLVTAARREAVDETVFFANKLTEAGLRVDALVVNRVHPRFGPPAAEAKSQSWMAAVAVESTTAEPVSPTGRGAALATLDRNMAELSTSADREDAALVTLTSSLADAEVVKVPLLPADVHDVAGLADIGELILNPPVE